MKKSPLVVRTSLIRFDQTRQHMLSSQRIQSLIQVNNTVNMKTVFALIYVAAAIGISQAVVCKVDSDCGADECCYIKPAFEIVSKRQLILPVPTVADTGVCERFHASDEHCYPLETANGHCGCVTGTSCQWVPEPTQVIAGKRYIFLPPGPGAFKCAP